MPCASPSTGSAVRGSGESPPSSSSPQPPRPRQARTNTKDMAPLSGRMNGRLVGWQGLAARRADRGSAPAREGDEGLALGVPQLQAEGPDAAADRDDRGAPEHR